METVKYEVKDKVAYVTLNRTDKVNAINLQMRIELSEILRDIKSNPEIWIAVFTGEGRAFSSGHDLVEGHKAGPPGTMNTMDIYVFLQNIYKPTICAINGICFAQGAGLALSCDIRIASREKTQIGWPQVKRGISSVSGPALLAQKVPLNLSLDLLYTGRIINAEEARALGIVNMVVPHDDLMAETERFIREIIQNAPIPMRFNKESAVRGMNMTFEDRVAFAAAMIEQSRLTEDAKEGLSAFVEKREPVWKGR